MRQLVEQLGWRRRTGWVDNGSEILMEALGARGLNKDQAVGKSAAAQDHSGRVRGEVLSRLHSTSWPAPGPSDREGILQVERGGLGGGQPPLQQGLMSEARSGALQVHRQADVAP